MGACICLVRLINPPNSPFREDFVGNITKVKSASGVISNTIVSNAVVTTKPRNANQENPQLPHHALYRPVQLPTPVKLSRLTFYLEGYPFKSKQYLLSGFEKGFSLDYTGPRTPSACNNLLSAIQNPAAVGDKLSK